MEKEKVNITIEWILHILISLGTKFHFKQRTLNLGTKFANKGYFQEWCSNSEYICWTFVVYPYQA